MKFASYKKQDGKQSWGALAPNGKILDCSFMNNTLLEFLRTDWQKRSSEIEAEFSSADIDPEAVKFLACVPNPPSMRDGYAFKQHVEAARKNRGVDMIPEYYDFPIFYFTNHQAVIGPGDCIVRERHLEKLDFELEAAIVVGKEGINISAKDADEYIAGYTIMNDFSARAMQMQEMKLNLGPAKGKDFATSLGKWLVTRDELKSVASKDENGERHDLTMTARVNDTEVSRGNLKDITFTFAQILERVSYGAKIYPPPPPGSGTVGTGCFLELNGSKITDNQWLKDGDQIVLEIDQLGDLKNTIKLNEPS